MIIKIGLYGTQVQVVAFEDKMRYTLEIDGGRAKTQYSLCLNQPNQLNQPVNLINQSTWPINSAQQTQ